MKFLLNLKDKSPRLIYIGNTNNSIYSTVQKSLTILNYYKFLIPNL